MLQLPYLGPTMAPLTYLNNYAVFKTVNRKPICRPKDSDPVTFCFLLLEGQLHIQGSVTDIGHSSIYGN